MAAVALIGARELMDGLENITPAIQKKAMRKELRSGAKIIMENTKGFVPVGKGKRRKSQRLASNFTVRAMKRSRVRIGYRIITRNSEPFVRTTKDGTRYFVPTILEYGSAKRNIAPHPFMRPGVDTAKGRVVAHLASGIKRNIDEEMRKIAAKTARARAVR